MLLLQNGREKAIAEEDADSACSLEGSTADSGRGSNDDTTTLRHNIAPPPIPQRLAVNNSPRHPRTIETFETRHLEPGLHQPATPSPRANTRDVRFLYPADNKQYYDQRVFQHGAQRSSSRGQQQPQQPPPAYNHNNRLHVPSPSPSLQYQPGHEPNVNRNIHRQRSLNIPELPSRKSVHYCSQV